MEEKLLEYSDELVEAIKSGVQFTSEQAPIFIQEVLNYYFFLNSLWICIFLLVGCSLLVWSYVVRIKWIPEDDFWGGFDTVLNFASFLLFLATTPFCVTLYKITYAPRLFLIEKLTTIL